MLEPLSVMRDASHLLSSSESIREWLQWGRSGRKELEPLPEDPLGFMEWSTGLRPLTVEERQVIGATPVSRTGSAGSRVDLASRSLEWSVEASVPHSAHAQGGSRVVDARPLFEARLQSRRMAAVESVEDLFGARHTAPISLEEWRSPLQAHTEPLALVGEGLFLWYRVDAEALSARMDAQPALLMGRGVIGIGVGLYRQQVEGESADPARREAPMREVSVVGMVRGEQGPHFKVLSRLVDGSSRSDALRRLAFQQPRELARIAVERTEDRWKVAGRWHGGTERLEIEVAGDHWLNRFGAGQLLSMLLPVRRVRWPVGAGSGAMLQLDPRNRMRIGRAERVVLPERLHQGLLTPETMNNPLSVTVATQMQLTVSSASGW